MRVLNPKNGTLQRLSKKHITKVNGLIDRQAVTQFHQKARKRDIYRREKQIEGKRVVIKNVKVRTIYKHPAQ